MPTTIKTVVGNMSVFRRHISILGQVTPGGQLPLGIFTTDAISGFRDLPMESRRMQFLLSRSSETRSHQRESRPNTAAPQRGFNIYLEFAGEASAA